MNKEILIEVKYKRDSSRWEDLPVIATIFTDDPSGDAERFARRRGAEAGDEVRWNRCDVGQGHYIDLE